MTEQIYTPTKQCMHFNQSPFAMTDSPALNYMFDLMEVIKLSLAEPYRKLLSLRALRAAPGEVLKESRKEASYCVPTVTVEICLDSDGYLGNFEALCTTF